MKSDLIQNEKPTEKEEKKTADLSSVIVDINKAAAAAKQSNQSPTVKKSDSPAAIGTKRPTLQHQTSLSASASAAVGAASEAGKFIASKLSNEVNLKGAKEMVLAAASHLKGSGGVPNSRIKFTNLEVDDDDDENDDDDDDDDDYADVDEVESTMEDENEDEDIARKQRQKRNRRNQSVISAALSSYKQKQMGGYKKAGYDENDEFEEEEDDDDSDDDKVKLNILAPFRKGAKSKGATPLNKHAGAKTVGGEQKDGAEKTTSPSDDDTKTSPDVAGLKLTEKAGLAKSRLSRSTTRSSVRASSSTRRSRKSSTRKSRNHENDEDDFDHESGRNFKCLDNSVALLIKTRFEETMLRIATIAIMFVAAGIFIIFSLPPPMPPEDIVNILKRS